MLLRSKLINTSFSCAKIEEKLNIILKMDVGFIKYEIDNVYRLIEVGADDTVK